VVDFSRRDVAELYELREALEIYAVGKAAAHKLRPVELEILESVVKDVLLLRDELEASREHQLNADGMRRFIRMDLQFHTRLVRAAANSRILKVVADTRVLLHIFGIRRKGHDAAQLTQIHRYHSEILGAIVRQDPVEATRLIGEHIRVSKEERLKEYDERERETALGHPLADLYSVDVS
jgi:DNA-binding GntR family transcriptional regulator